MSDVVLPVSPGVLPAGFCPTDYQDMLNNFSANQTVTLPLSQGNLIVSATTPTDTSAVWLQLDSFGRPVRFYYFASGAWLSLHPDVPGKTIIWTTALPTLTTFDGGDASALSAISGPMWEVVTTLQARSPIGVGTLASGTAIAVADQIGEENHLLTDAESAVQSTHSHITGRFNKTTNDDVYVSIAPGSDTAPSLTGRYIQGQSGANTKVQLSTLSGDYMESGPVAASVTPTAHNTIHPVTGVYFLRRTARLFYRV